MIKRIAKLPRIHSFFLFGPRLTGKSTLIKSVFQRETTDFAILPWQEIFAETGLA